MSSGSRRERSGGRWWYLVAAVPIAYVVPALLAPLVFLFVLTGSLGIVAGGPPELFGAVGGVGFSLLVVVIATVALAAVAVTLLLPVALYKDIELVDRSEVDWHPDRDLYVLMSVAGIFVSGLSAAVALYYLYRRHQHVGVP